MGKMTRDGYATNAQIARQRVAWTKARVKLLERMGGKEAVLDDKGKLNKPYLNDKAREFFQEMDVDKNEKIDPGELRLAFSKLGLEISLKDAKEMVHEADADGCVGLAATPPLP